MTTLVLRGGIVKQFAAASALTATANEPRRLLRKVLRGSLRVNLSPTLSLQCGMDSSEDFNSETIERLGKQGGFLLSTYHAELAKDPASHATESSRSNVIALWHTIKQIYGKAVARDLISSRQKSPTTIECQGKVESSAP
jgi:hypothetical protein